MSLSVSMIDKMLVLILIFLVSDYFKYFEKYTMRLSNLIAERYGDRQMQNKFPQKASDLIAYDFMVLVSLFGLIALIRT